MWQHQINKASKENKEYKRRISHIFICIQEKPKECHLFLQGKFHLVSYFSKLILISDNKYSLSLFKRILFLTEPMPTIILQILKKIIG